MKTLSAFLARMADMFETHHADGGALSFDAELVGYFGMAFRECVDQAATLERRARLCSDLEAYVRELNQERIVNAASDFVDVNAGDRRNGDRGETAIFPFKAKEEAP